MSKREALVDVLVHGDAEQFRLALAQRDLELLPGNGDYILKQRGQPMPEPAPAYRAPAYPAPGYRAPGYGTPAYPSPTYPPAGGASGDRKSVVSGKSGSVRVDLGGRRIIKKQTENTHKYHEDNDTHKSR